MESKLRLNSTADGRVVTLAAKTVAEPTKRSLRDQTWKKIQDKKVALDGKHVFNLIPGFVNSDKAAALVVQTDEFKNAQNIEVHIGASLHEAKLEVLLAGKTLYLPAARDSDALYVRVDVPENATDEQKKEILLNKNKQKHTEISLDNKAKLDMVFIGSVLVSRNGHRIGCGNDFADLDMGLLIELGVMTADTVIATLVHDVQVVKSLPVNIFEKYDIPVDLIVTPTEVIRVERQPRPAGIYWELLSERYLKIMPVLQIFKETQENAGIIITLKASSDNEENTKIVKLNAATVDNSSV